MISYGLISDHLQVSDQGPSCLNAKTWSCGAEINVWPHAISCLSEMFFKGYPLEVKTAPKN